jgi:hypothetical protein
MRHEFKTPCLLVVAMPAMTTTASAQDKASQQFLTKAIEVNFAEV